MSIKSTNSEKKQKLIDNHLNSPIIVGDVVLVKKSSLTSYPSSRDKIENQSCDVLNIEGDVFTVKDRYSDSIHKIDKQSIISKGIGEIGANPFVQSHFEVRCVAFTLDSILFNLNVLEEKDNKDYKIKDILIKELNWNPFVYTKEGKKEYYQRPFVWTLEDKQLLIESIYQGIDCGKIVVRERSWGTLEKMVEVGETDLAFHDIVDGKQRLNAIKGFIQNEYLDLNGNFFSDLSNSAQYFFTNHQLLTYGALPENSTDEQVIKQFLKLNFAGVPQSKEHIKFVKSINQKM